MYFSTPLTPLLLTPALLPFLPLSLCRDSDANLPDTVQYLINDNDKSCPNNPQFIRGSDAQISLQNTPTQLPSLSNKYYGRVWCTPGTKTWLMILDYDINNLPSVDNVYTTGHQHHFGLGPLAILDALAGAADLVNATLAKNNNGAVVSGDGVIHAEKTGVAWQFRTEGGGGGNGTEGVGQAAGAGGGDVVEIKVYNRQPYQITYGVLGAGLRGTRDFMRVSNATTDGYVYVADGGNVVGLFSVKVGGGGG